MSLRSWVTNLTTTRRTAAIGGLTLAVTAVAATTSVQPAEAQEPAACLSPDPADWPEPSKPYFMLAVDTSGSMTTGVATANSCGYAPNNRNAHSRCALRNTLLAFGGQVNFGLATFAVEMTGCSGAACYAGCGFFCTTAEFNQGTCAGCGPGAGATRAGAIIRVPMQQHDFWNTPQQPSNIDDLLVWNDDACTNDEELFAVGNTPLNGILRDMQRYFQSGWTHPDGTSSFPSPLAAQDLDGSGVNGSTGCRSINVILQTDGDETCDTQADAVAAAAALYNTGVTVGGKNYRIRTHVINFQGGNQANTDAIAAAGGTTNSFFATNEVELSQALADIIASAIQPEVCDNTDNNCNGCTDEGYRHYCNTGKTCCAWNNQTERDTCLANYEASITPAAPDGNVDLLPCTTPAQASVPAEWLCFDPQEVCDSIDNNCVDGTDENVVTCGNPPHCPLPETCNGEDDNCNGLIDEGVCGGCVPSPEICDGCDNNCNGLTDDGVGPVPCGLATPANCTGTQSCLPPQVVPPGGCVAGGGYGPCSDNPQPEVCDGIDNNCNGIPDDGVVATQCEPPGAPPGLIYGPTSQCQLGLQPCGGTCQGWIGPSAEVCDGIDNDCNGVVDDNPFNVGQPCGVSTPPCSPGLTACVNGALVCQGGTGPQPEVCDGIDNNCNGLADEAPLADAPPAGMNGCWNDPGNCCTFQNLNWCPPPGANCTNAGTLTSPCNAGVLACAGAAGWVCQGPNGPQPEVCDGIDNNCNGMADDGPIPQVGNPCGDDTGECQMGTLDCVAGGLDCVGDIGPTQEICDGLDNDCNGVNDNGIPTGGPCTPTYDTVAFPGPRNNPPCQPGVLQCDGMGGIVCVGGVGPMAEVCDGIDNDCDGTADEPGAAPDGLDGSANPFPPPDANIGDACGNDVGICTGGAYACVNGQFACLGGQNPQVETCDCQDNDCDGTQDNENPNNNPPLCSPGKTCIQGSSGCQCAEPCSGGELPCPTGQTCEAVLNSSTGESIGNFCVADPCLNCSQQTKTDANGEVLCAPAGTMLADCEEPPVCVCKGQNGCQAPCFGVTCDPGLVCKKAGQNAGTCVIDNCYNNPCVGCDQACNGGSCVDNPCATANCSVDEVCKPSADFTSFTCVGSCADVTCPSGQVCVDGACAPSCDPPCAGNQVCNEGVSPPTCVENLCNDPFCVDGSCCDPITGQCGNCPCEGIICPESQICSDGECYDAGSVGGNGSGGGSGAMASGGASNNGGTTSGDGNEDDIDGVFGLATGGGGCACEVGGNQSKAPFGWLSALIGLVALQRRRKRVAKAEAGR